MCWWGPGCLRRRSWLAPVAWVAGFVEAVELMHGEAAMPAVCDLFGAGAFAPGGQRFAAFCQRRLHYPALDALSIGDRAKVEIGGDTRSVDIEGNLDASTDAFRAQGRLSSPWL